VTFVELKLKLHPTYITGRIAFNVATQMIMIMMIMIIIRLMLMLMGFNNPREVK